SEDVAATLLILRSVEALDVLRDVVSADLQLDDVVHLAGFAADLRLERGRLVAASRRPGSRCIRGRGQADPGHPQALQLVRARPFLLEGGLGGAVRVDEAL